MYSADISVIPSPIATMLTNEFLRGERAFFVGAGCSADSPSSLPTSSKLAEDLARLLGCSTSDSSWCQQELGKATPSLEDVAEKVVSHKRGSLYHDCKMIEWLYRPPNLNHKIIAQMFAESFIKVLVTTNYDDLIERCLREDLEVRINEPIIDEADFAIRSDDKPTIVKIHGSITKFNSVRIATRDFENWEAEWAKGYVAGLLRNYSLVFLAYSASDPHIMETFSKVVGATHQGATWALKQRTSQVDAILQSLGINPEEQIVCDVKDFLLEIRSRCLNAAFQQILETRTQPSLRYYVPDDDHFTPINDILLRVSRALSQSVEASEYFKIFSGFFEKAYLPLRPNPDKLNSLLLWLSLFSYAIERPKPTTWTLNPFQKGFHLRIENTQNGHRLGIFFVDTNLRKIDTVLGGIQAWLSASAATELGRFPQVHLRPDDLIEPQKVLIVLTENTDPAPELMRLTLSTTFFSDTHEATVNCIGTNQCATVLRRSLDDFVSLVQEQVRII